MKTNHKKISLKDVTLLAATSIRIPDTIGTLRKSCVGITFGEVKLISHEKPNDLPDFISFEKCSKINNIFDFNLYAFKDLWKHVETTHCLLIHHDSYVLNPTVWEDDWLDYDYIGAPWRIVHNVYMANNGERVRVGNGGFSLRSKKVLEAPEILGLELMQEEGGFNEDCNVCCHHRRELLDYGIKYAPLEVAVKFSYENDIEENIGVKPFGFHRNLPRWDYLID